MLSAADSYNNLNDEATLKILSPAWQDTKTAKIELSNGLKAYLISDPHTDQAGASLSVLVGSWQEPEAYPGIAHFTEHLLFLGNKKYPDESAFDKFVAQFGGSTNAFTTNSNTNYVFSVDNQAFTEALDRFSSFFKDPLFNPSGVGRELQAIDEEYSKNIESDDIRLDQTLSSLGNPLHPNSRFSMGNIKSLEKVSRETLIDWYQKHYSANLMRLVVISQLPLDELKELVTQEFSGIPNHNLQFPPINLLLTSPQTKDKLVYVTPVKNTQKLYISWQLPESIAKVKWDQPQTVVCGLLGGEAPGSLLYYLKQQQFAQGLFCGAHEEGDGVFTLSIEIMLTSQGLDNVEKVIHSIFSAINTYKSKVLPPYIFDEIQQMARIGYQYQSNNNTFDTLMKHAFIIPKSNFNGYPEDLFVPRMYNPEAIAEIFKLLTPNNATFAIVAPPSATKINTDKTEEWMNVDYAITPIPAEWLKDWQDAGISEDFAIPPPNPFIPESLSLVSESKSKEEGILPKLTTILSNDQGAVYFAQDNIFHLPTLSLQFKILTPQVDEGNPYKTVMADLYASALNTALISLSYPALQAGLNFNLTRDDFGIGITVDGYSAKAYVLLDKISQMMRELQFSEERFKIDKEELIQRYQNDILQSPLEASLVVLKSALCKKYALPEQLLNAIKKVSFESFKEYAQEIFQKVFVQGILFGNLTQDEATKISNVLISNLKSKPYPVSQQQSREVLVFPKDKGPFYFETIRKSKGNATLLCISLGDYSFKLRAAQQVLMEFIGQPFFQTLRTQQQTGYLVTSVPYQLEKQLFNLFIVQSSVYDPRDLLARFELFIEDFLRLPASESMPKESFESVRGAQINKLRKPAKNISEMAKLLFEVTFVLKGNSDWIQKRIQGFEELEYDAFLVDSQQLLGRNNRRQLGILIRGAPTSDQSFNFTRLHSLTQLRKLATFSSNK